MTAAEIIVVVVCGVIVVGAIALAVWRKIKGKTCCDCSDCAYCHHCRKKENKD